MRDRWIRVEVDPRVTQEPTFALPTAPGTIFHDAVPIIFGHDLVGAVVPALVKTTGTVLSISELRVVLAHI
jgi:hypothetical protein